LPKRLILIRHAKSSWETTFDDHARRLNNRGRQAATSVGHWLRDVGHLPDAIYTSDAARTRETTALVADAIANTPSITPVQDMYHGSPATLLNILRQATSDTVALVAHNPGIAFFAADIVAKAPKHSRFLDYPTCATLVCEFDIEKWADAVARSAHVVDFIVPKDLGV